MESEASVVVIVVSTKAVAEVAGTVEEVEIDESSAVVVVAAVVAVARLEIAAEEISETGSSVVTVIILLVVINMVTEVKCDRSTVV